jgi:large subunit ribosomal protein L10
MSKKIKAMELADLRQTFNGVKDYVIVEPLKVDSATEYTFRKRLREKKISAKMVKNSFAKKIFGEMGIQQMEVWSGPTILCWGGANVKELSNTVETLVKELKKDPKAPEKFKIKTGVADGQQVAIDVMKTLPTREEAIADLLGCILAPGSNLVACLTAPGADLASILKTIEEKQAEAAPAAAS